MKAVVSFVLLLFVAQIGSAQGGGLEIRLGSVNPYRIPDPAVQFQDVPLLSLENKALRRLDSHWPTRLVPDYLDMKFIKTKNPDLRIMARFASKDKEAMKKFIEKFKAALTTEVKDDTLFLKFAPDLAVDCWYFRSNGAFNQIRGVCLDSVYLGLPKGVGVKQIRVYINDWKIPAPTWIRKLVFGE